MAQVRPKAIFIGDERVGAALAKIRTDWDFLPHSSNIKQFWNDINSGAISNDIQIILLMDAFFEPNGEATAFEQLVASFGPYCFFGIVNYRTNYTEHMKERIEIEAYSLNSKENLHYYFIDPKKPNLSLDAAINKFSSEFGIPEVVEIITGRISAEERQNEIERREAERAQEQSKFDLDGESPYMGKVLAVTSSKGGSGKSTVAITLATYLAHASANSVKEGLEEKPLKIALLDLDVRDGQIGFLTNNSQPTVLNLRMKGITKDIIEDTVIHSQQLKIDLLLAPKRPRNMDDTPSDFYVELIHALRQMYDYVILDTSVNYLDPLLEKVAYPAADQILYVTDIVVNSIYGMTRWIQEVTKDKEKGGMGINKNKIGIVVNKSLSNVNMPGERIAQSAMGLRVITAVPSNPKLIAHAANIQSMEVLLRHKDLYPVFRQLARAIVGKRYNLSNNVNP